MPTLTSFKTTKLELASLNMKLMNHLTKRVKVNVKVCNIHPMNIKDLKK